ncbi:MAG: asparagine synthase (glutamine-hydrolyzing) [candidate division Zixibacteria bacterium]|nr:asparagine synthase (glutamine-hydrolyzing) [candidate division Zixibacteria bacterium]
MCGITGVFRYGEITGEDRQVAEQMTHILAHRGPDDEGFFVDDTCALGHRRLAIIDLSRDGHQPFVSDDDRYRMVYNGEIYNYIELREELTRLGWSFRTRTDIEVLLKAYQQFGPACLPKLNGMFSIAIYDRERRHLFLARDHVGIKPLYYTFVDGTFYFASEIKALRAIPRYSKEIDPQAVFDFLVFNRTDVFDETFIRSIRRIPKGHYGLLDREGLKLTQWWDPATLAGEPQTANGHVAETVESLMVDAVRLQMRSDVPVGSCLSGGLDSSILAGLIFAGGHATDRFATFTSSFPGHPIDETRYVEALNRRYPFKNHRTFPTAQSAYDHFERFVHTIDEPVADSSFYAQYEVMRLAKSHGITVLLDGQGGDENFAGYQYFHGFYLSGLFHTRRYGAFAREGLNIMLRRQDRSAYQTFLFQMAPDALKKHMLQKHADLTTPEFFDRYIDSSLIFREFFDAPDLHTSLIRHFQYKLEHLLRLEDRNAMAFSLEARVPYLDPRLIEYVLRLPDDLKIRGGATKHLQKQALGRYTVPEILARTDKIGFGTPMDEWMAAPEWQARTTENYRYLAASLPGVLTPDAGLPTSSSARWKINQLAQWHRMVMGT